MHTTNYIMGLSMSTSDEKLYTLNFDYLHYHFAFDWMILTHDLKAIQVISQRKGHERKERFLPHKQPPLFPIITRELNLKSCQNFVGTNFFSYIYGGSNICYYTFIVSFSQKQPTPRKIKCFLYEFLQEMRMHQKLLVANILKFTKKVLQKNFNYYAY